jgi:RNA polymerase sigma factor (sigma-70 family)
MADPVAVEAMAAGDPAGLESVYRRYADRIYAYARSIVADGDTDADVVQETFLLAQQRVRQLRDPDRLASWLYAIARNECLARLRARKRTVMLDESHDRVLDTDPGRALHAAQVKELVHAASAGMNDGDREVFELTVRHGLSAADVARVLDISDKHAHARISRVRDQFEGALGALVMARDSRGRCEELDGVLRGWDGQLTALLRKRIERHTRECAVCAARRRERMNPASLLAAYAALPFLAVAAALWPRLQVAVSGAPGGLASGAGPAPAAPSSPPLGTSAVAEGPTSPVHMGSGPGGDAPTLALPSGGGGPARSGDARTRPLQTGGGAPTIPIRAGGQPAPEPRRSRKGVFIAAPIAVLLIILGTSAVRLATLDRSAAPGGPVGTASGSPSEVTPSTPPPTTPGPPPPFTVTASGEWRCAFTPHQFRITAQASGVAFDEVTAHYQAPVIEETQDLDVNAFQAQAQFVPGSFVPEITWWVVAKSIDGRTRTTSPVMITNSCFP